jgi:CheY-like chemotaxis protein
VLVVDDEPTVRMLVTEVLQQSGYHAIEASDGPTALKILHSNARIDMLIADVGLPGGINGRQVADAAVAKRRELKVLFITGYAENAAVGNESFYYDVKVLTKPFTINELCAKMQDILGPPGEPLN